jgi:hypothetical protein
MTENAMRESQDRLLKQAVGVLRARYENGFYPDVSPDEAAGVVGALEAVADARDDHGIDRDEAVALAHRLVDDDKPEISPLWPRSRL